MLVLTVIMIAIEADDLRGQAAGARLRADRAGGGPGGPAGDDRLEPGGADLARRQRDVLPRRGGRRGRWLEAGRDASLLGSLARWAFGAVVPRWPSGSATPAIRRRAIASDCSLAEAAAAPTEAPKRPPMIQPGAYKPKERIMVPTQGNPRLIEFALKECKTRQAELASPVRPPPGRHADGPDGVPKLDEDEQALDLVRPAPRPGQGGRRAAAAALRRRPRHPRRHPRHGRDPRRRPARSWARPAAARSGRP